MKAAEKKERRKCEREKRGKPSTTNWK